MSGQVTCRRVSQVPTMRTGPALRRQLALEDDLAPAQIGGVFEPLGPFGAVRIDDSQHVPSFGHVADFVAQELAASFEPPEHGIPPFVLSAEPRLVLSRGR